MPRTAPAPLDPLQLLRLLWEPETSVGRSGTTLAGVVRAAIALADAEGLEALTMRRLATEVGVGAMTLYGYVPGRAPLLELMADHVVASTYEGQGRPAEDGDWRAALRHIAACNYAHGIAHPWLGDISPSRPILGPGYLLKYEDELEPLDGIGLDDAAMDQALTHALALAQHAARWQVAMDRARRESRLADAQWWQLVAPHLTTALGGRELPVSSRVGQSLAHAGDPPGFLDQAVDALVRDLERRLESGAGGGDAS